MNAFGAVMRERIGGAGRTEKRMLCFALLYNVRWNERRRGEGVDLI